MLTVFKVSIIFTKSILGPWGGGEDQILFLREWGVKICQVPMESLVGRTSLDNIGLAMLTVFQVRFISTMSILGPRRRESQTLFPGEWGVTLGGTGSPWNP